jgi:hypothetical protein
MPLLTEASALALWAASRRRFISPIIAALADQVSAEDITDGIIDALLSRDDGLLAWLFERIEAAADKLDARLTWRNIRNDKLRAWLEAHDDVYPHLLAGLRVLASSIGSEVDRLSAYDSPAAAKADEMRALLSAGGGPTAGFFHLSGPSPETPRSSGSQRGGRVAIEEQTALAVIGPSVEELAAENDELHRLLTDREDELAATRADLWALQSGDDDLPPSLDDDPPVELEQRDPTPAIEPEIIAEDEDPLSPAPLVGPYDAPETVAGRARAAIVRDRATGQTGSRATPNARKLRQR